MTATTVKTVAGRAIEMLNSRFRDITASSILHGRRRAYEQQLQDVSSVEDLELIAQMLTDEYTNPDEDPGYQRVLADVETLITRGLAALR